ncbi:hypothetical protein OHS33_39695 (plasmid) [Streptomyces sp. NBC_00536]|uniref:hypothetical protein n=1 Tax=Streptomyces sp. NBC_00536 TaxID=2975769 RepID=UPI002E803598|nr:hypothetical protein [Streptomyces sp. NBC_00536]WUC84492.1 hypothetical protein OHS33_39695 [Streptomyces sp. NBC_00536]
MFVILSTRKNRELNITIQNLHDRAESNRRWHLEAEQRIEKAMELLEGQDTEQAQQLRAALKGGEQQ